MKNINIKLAYLTSVWYADFVFSICIIVVVALILFIGNLPFLFQINKLSIEHNAALCLSKEARRWASCVMKEVRVTRESQEELRKLLAQIGDKV